VKLAEHIYTFTHTSSNASAIIGDEGVILVDAGKSAEEGTRILAAIATLTSKPVRLLLNTHKHTDHVGGNIPIVDAGAIIVAQKEVRTRLLAATNPQSASDAAFPERALPTITSDRELTLHCGNEEVFLLHPSADHVHTDGDTVVFYRHANVVHMGDLYFEGTYPVIDFRAGGWIGGMVVGCREMLARIDDRTVVIPGHGPVANKAHLEAYVSMLSDIGAKVTALIQAGKTLDEVKAAKPTAAYDQTWGKGRRNGDQFTEIVYNGIVAHMGK
jgi:glyoxylase-like metal-dependent hydrolase (beta-lactamase superfamily II)